jgi:signal transduction histidine kinase
VTEISEPAIAAPRERGPSVGGLLTRAFATLIAMIVILGLIRVVVTEPLFQAAEDRRSHLLEVQAANTRVRTLYDRGQLAIDGYLATGDRAYLVPYEAAREEAPVALADLIRLGGSTVDTATVRDRTESLWQEADSVIQLRPDEPGAATDIADAQGRYRRATVASDAVNAAVIRGLNDVFRTVQRLRTVTVLVAILITALAAAVAAVIGVRTTRRIVRPLGRVVEVLERFAGGEVSARASPANAPREIAAVATAVNSMADEVIQARGRYEDERRMYQEVQELGTIIRRLTTVAPAMAAAAEGMGEALHADHVVVRLAKQEGRRIAPTVWSAPGAAGDPAVLADTPVTWWPAAGTAPFVVDAVPTGAGPPPEPERAALRTAGAGPVITVALGDGDDQLGHVTLIRRAGTPGWGPLDVRLVELSAGDLGRTLVNARLYEREHRLVQQLQELNETKAGLMSTVSHELRTPLTSISGYLELLRDEEAGPINAAQARMLEVVDRNTTRLRNLIEDLLIVSRIQEGTYQGTMAPVDTAALVSAALHAIEPVAEKAGVTLTSDIQGPLPVRGDIDQLDRLMMNLLSNAVKFTPAGGAVAVAADRNGPDVVISVRDTGIGIPAADQQKLFSRFFRASNATAKAIQGTGLGLSIVYAIVDQHGGALTVDSKEGEGSTFTVLLPVADLAGPTDD